MSDVTHILARIESGDPIAADQLLPLVYDELRKLAAARLTQERPDLAMIPTWSCPAQPPATFWGAKKKTCRPKIDRID